MNATDVANRNWYEYGYGVDGNVCEYVSYACVSWFETNASHDDRPQMHMHPRFLRAGLWRTSNKYKLSA